VENTKKKVIKFEISTFPDCIELNTLKRQPLRQPHH